MLVLLAAGCLKADLVASGMLACAQALLYLSDHSLMAHQQTWCAAHPHCDGDEIEDAVGDQASPLQVAHGLRIARYIAGEPAATNKGLGGTQEETWS